jgi:hypothetical protein
MRIAQSAGQALSRLEGDDLVVRPMPAAGLLMPGANDAVVTPDGVLVVDESEQPLYFITTSGLVIGRAEHILRDGRGAQRVQQAGSAQAAGAADS